MALADNHPSAFVRRLLAEMTLEEKVGQMSQRSGFGDRVPDDVWRAVAAGEVGSLLNIVGLGTVNELQRTAVEQSRLGIPLLIGRDVIHGFRTVFPIPLGQAASWHPQGIREWARIAASEAAAAGVNWTFAPMVDVSRDPRWGRIAESFGEDPYLVSRLGVAALQGYQHDGSGARLRMAACAKHFAGYGASEAGRDYASVDMSEQELRNVHLAPFKAAVDAGVATLMPSFSELNGVPPSGDPWLLRQVLRDEWRFDGLVVSDWESIPQLAVHGFTAGDRDSALAAATAGIDMEMASTSYRAHLAALVRDGRIPEADIDRMAGHVLQLKFDLGLFERPYVGAADVPPAGCERHLAAAREAARESLVLLKNEGAVLPLDAPTLRSIAVIGPLADDPYEQLGTWVFDGDPALSQTPLAAIRALLGARAQVHFAPALATSRSRSIDGFERARAAAADAEVVLLCLGEEAILSGEAHSRASIDLPGAQEALIDALAELGKPLVLVVMAGRPLTLGRVVDKVDAILYAWHPGTMAGPAIADALFGVVAPSGKLPVTFPRMVGQVPLYYAHKHTGKPPTPESFTFIDDIEPRAPQTSVGNTSFYLDAGYTPLFPFGFGLSYTEFSYDNIEVNPARVTPGQPFEVRAELSNVGNVAGVEVAQLYVRDLVGSVTRPVRELKGFQRVHLEPGERTTVTFRLTADDLAFAGRDNRFLAEPGEFLCWVGGSSLATLEAGFELVAS